jgi:hypothetical protein
MMRVCDEPVITTGNLLGSRVWFWLASRPDLTGHWSQAGMLASSSSFGVRLYLTMAKGLVTCIPSMRQPS